MPLQLIKVLSALPNNNWYCFRNFNLFFYFDSSNQQLISQQAYSINFTQTINTARQLALNYALAMIVKKLKNLRKNILLVIILVATLNKFG